METPPSTPPLSVERTQDIDPLQYTIEFTRNFASRINYDEVFHRYFFDPRLSNKIIPALERIQQVQKLASPEVPPNLHDLAGKLLADKIFFGAMGILQDAPETTTITSTKTHHQLIEEANSLLLLESVRNAEFLLNRYRYIPEHPLRAIIKLLQLDEGHSLPPALLSAIGENLNTIAEQPFPTLQLEEAQEKIASLPLVGIPEQTDHKGTLSASFVRRALQQDIPEAFLQGLLRIEFIPGRRWIAGDYDRDHRIISSYEPVSLKDSVQRKFKHTVYHEIGHHVHSTLSFDELQKWEDACRHERYALYTLLGLTKNRKAQEVFAAAFSEFAREPALLLAKSPKRFDYMKQLFASQLPEDQRQSFYERLKGQTRKAAVIKAKLDILRLRSDAVS